jgi:hypothetical protein
MREVALTLKKETQFDVVFLSLQYLNEVTDVNRVAQQFARKLVLVSLAVVDGSISLVLHLVVKLYL